MIGQRDQAMSSMRSYQEQCDGLRGEIAAQEQKITALLDQVQTIVQCILGIS